MSITVPDNDQNDYVSMQTEAALNNMMNTRATSLNKSFNVNIKNKGLKVSDEFLPNNVGER